MRTSVPQSKQKGVVGVGVNYRFLRAMVPWNEGFDHTPPTPPSNRQDQSNQRPLEPK